MVDKVTETPAMHGEYTNRKGRPRKGNIIRFGPQPQSMVSKLLNKIKAECYDVPVEIETHDALIAATTAASNIGRPSKGDTNAQHEAQSMVSMIVNTADCSEHDENENDDNVTNTPSSPIYETDQTEDDCPTNSKMRKLSTMKEPVKPETYACEFEECSYTSKLASNMTKHKRVHTGEKPYLCDRCSFRSNFINSLKVHKRLHTEVRPYKCSDCDYHCNSLSNLKKHCQSRHKVK